MPKSRIRKKSDYTPPTTTTATPVKLKSGRGFVAPIMLGLFLAGLVWIVVYYVTSAQWPISAIGNWNIVIGFGFIAAGFGVSTQWK
ncbi:cell division protein CrgA [Streptacidiphilus rugosus]|uniref:cell division protein CrgA n=1 Tax=Streptacidiphilus rugosus TaxID=405783 RepID=UPI00055E766E|nr:cell division protein CrgA [Streptacidiphilus rugosus]